VKYLETCLLPAADLELSHQFNDLTSQYSQALGLISGGEEGKRDKPNGSPGDAADDDAVTASHSSSASSFLQGMSTKLGRRLRANFKHISRALRSRPARNPGAGVYGLLCDIAVVKDPRVAHVLSMKRRSALTTFLVDSTSTTLRVRRYLDSHGHTSPLAFIAVGTAENPCNTMPRRNLSNLTPVTSSPGFRGFAVDMFDLAPEYEWLRGAILYSLFGEIAIFDTNEHAQVAAQFTVPQSNVGGAAAPQNENNVAGGNGNNVQLEDICCLGLDAYDAIKLEFNFAHPNAARWKWSSEEEAANPFLGSPGTVWFTAGERRDRADGRVQSAVLKFASRHNRRTTPKSRERAVQRAAGLRGLISRYLQILEGDDRKEAQHASTKDATENSPPLHI